MPPSLRVPIGSVAILAALTLAALSALYAGDATPGRFDAWIPPANGTLYDTALVIDFGGERLGAALLVSVTAAGCLVLGRPRSAVLAVAGPGATVVWTTLLKPVVGRTIHGEYLSFPSGHTAVATALALVLALPVVDLTGAGRLIGVVLVLIMTIPAAAAMGWAQVVLDAHYPTDAIGGFCTALAVVPATAWLIDVIP